MKINSQSIDPPDSDNCNEDTHYYKIKSEGPDGEKLLVCRDCGHELLVD